MGSVLSRTSNSSGKVGTVGPQKMRKLDGLVDVGQESKVIRNFDFNRTFIFLGLAEPQLQLLLQIVWVPSPHDQVPVNLDVTLPPPGFPSQICTAQYHPTTKRLQDILEPAVCLLHFDFVKFTGAVHHRLRNHGDENQVPAWSGLGGFGDGGLLSSSLGLLERSGTTRTCQRTTPVGGLDMLRPCLRAGSTLQPDRCCRFCLLSGQPGAGSDLRWWHALESWLR